jgi:hypothetical protein
LVIHAARSAYGVERDALPLEDLRGRDPSALSFSFRRLVARRGFRSWITFSQMT